ncbi:MAG: hypothetical protein K9G33_03645 [Sneathiella sp.]|nr:hypothetical protein [Sneathiella sp.]
MIRIRYLTPGSLAMLVVKAAEEQMAARLVCKPPYEAFGKNQFPNPAINQEKRRHR